MGADPWLPRVRGEEWIVVVLKLSLCGAEDLVTSPAGSSVPLVGSEAGIF